jgi:hypothetical protein
LKPLCGIACKFRHHLLQSRRVLGAVLFPLLLTPVRRRASVPLPAGWKTQHDPIGFSIGVPPGWTARGDRATGEKLKSKTDRTIPNSVAATVFA